ncbi:MAG: MFS transporter [Bacteroidales bacterium]|nr:MFS transporter [Bacteroidales bacterium]
MFTFFCLYIAQSLPMTFFTTALQVTMRQASYSFSAIALLQFVKLPWILKFLWSPMIDKKCETMKGFRKCIFISEGIYAAIILLVGHLDLANSFNLIIGLIFLSFVASATQDIATDALAVLSFSKEEKGLVNSMQSLGSFCATLIGSGVLLALLQRFGWHYVLPFMALFVFFAMLPLYKNKNLKIESKENDKEVRKSDFIWFFTRKTIWKQIAFLMLYYASIIGVLSVIRPYLVDLGYTMKEIGMMSGVIGSAGACVASIASGHTIVFIGCFKARRIFAGITLATMLYFLTFTIVEPTYAMIIIGLIMLWMSYGLCTVVVYTTAMECVRPGREGTDFTIQTVITHLSGLLMALISGSIADNWGFTALFYIMALVAAANLLYVVITFKNEEKI